MVELARDIRARYETFSRNKTMNADRYFESFILLVDRWQGIESTMSSYLLPNVNVRPYNHVSITSYVKQRNIWCWL